MHLFEYRERDEAIDLQYSSDFSLPSNLKFIGTMNTADRSIRSVDVALRRRFDVIECAPDRGVLEQYYANSIGQNHLSSLYDGFEQLNERLTAELDRHHTIGHTFFMANVPPPPTRRSMWSYLRLAPWSPSMAASCPMQPLWRGNSVFQPSLAVKDVMKKINDGDRVRVDGDKGEVTVLS